MKLLAYAVLISISLLGPAKGDGWVLLPGKTSASFAKARGWFLVGTAAMSWSDGRQGLVTFWQRCYEQPSDISDGLCFTQRCIDFFDASLSETGGICQSAQYQSAQ